MENPGITATLKAGKDFDAPWIVLHATNPDQLNQQLDALDDALLQKVTLTAQLLIGANNAAIGGLTAPAQPQPTVQTPPYQAPTPPAQQAQQAAPVPADPPAYPAGGRPVGPRGEQPHPTADCNCGKPLYDKRTSGGKAVWRCLDWKWNAGNPNGHDNKWPNEVA